jgi:hypothetical protein
MKFNLICEEHPKYKAVLTPKGQCGPCWILYFLKNARQYTTSITQLGEESIGKLVVKR